MKNIGGEEARNKPGKSEGRSERGYKIVGYRAKGSEGKAVNSRKKGKKPTPSHPSEGQADKHQNRPDIEVHNVPDIYSVNKNLGYREDIDRNQGLYPEFIGYDHYHKGYELDIIKGSEDHFKGRKQGGQHHKHQKVPQPFKTGHYLV